MDATLAYWNDNLMSYTGSHNTLFSRVFNVSKDSPFISSLMQQLAKELPCYYPGFLRGAYPKDVEACAARTLFVSKPSLQKV